MLSPSLSPSLLCFRPVVRALPSQQLFQNVMSRHDVLFVYVGGPSDLKVWVHPRIKHTSTHTQAHVRTHACTITRDTINKWLLRHLCHSLSEVSSFSLLSPKEKYISVAKELIVHTYFFSAARNILPKVRFRNWVYRLPFKSFRSQKCPCFWKKSNF